MIDGYKSVNLDVNVLFFTILRDESNLDVSKYKDNKLLVKAVHTFQTIKFNKNSLIIIHQPN